MAKRSRKARDEQGRWEIQGGGLKWGDSPLDNLQREVLEECGVSPQRIEFLGYRSIKRKLKDGTPTHWISLDFAALVDRAKVRLNEPEMFDNMGWFTLERQPKPVHSQHKIFIAKYEDRLRKLLTTRVG